MNCDDNTKAEDLAKLKKCMFKLIFKIEHNYDKEEKVFSNAKVLRILQKDLMTELEKLGIHLVRKQFNQVIKEDVRILEKFLSKTLLNQGGE